MMERILLLLGVLALAAGTVGRPGRTGPEIMLPNGVRAVWDLEKAYREKTPTRERVCLNGLWRWQPAGEVADAVPSDRWGYFKVPGSWPGITDYMLDLVDRTREHGEIVLGASTRAALSLYRATQAFAVTAGRDYVIPDDVKALAEPALAHRLVTRGWTQGGHVDAGPVVNEILSKLKVPT